MVCSQLMGLLQDGLATSSFIDDVHIPVGALARISIMSNISHFSE